MTVWSQTFQSRTTNRYLLVSSKGISRAYLPGSLSPYEQQQILKKGERQSALKTAPGGTWLSHHLSITTLRAQTLFASHLLRRVLGTQGPTEQHTVAAFTHFTDKRRTETRWQVALGYDDKCVTNSSEHTMGGGTWPILWGSGKTFLEEVSQVKRKERNVSGSRSAVQRPGGQWGRPVHKDLSETQDGHVCWDRRKEWADPRGVSS